VIEPVSPDGFADTVEADRVEPARGPRDGAAVGLAHGIHPQDRRTRIEPQCRRHAGVGLLARLAEQMAATVLGLIAQTLRKARAPGNRVGKAPAPFDEGAPPLLRTQHALLHERGDGTANGMAVDAESLRQGGLRRQAAALAEVAGGNAVTQPVGDLAPERDARLSLHAFRCPGSHPAPPVTYPSWTRPKKRHMLYTCLYQ
jgi:hypothetical protein